ncbi:hypothetical protein [Sedimentibacter sp.]|uniref:hypothetical protein n=1 Tax=Sedimentibacter sp. TaxID=1960295 RepID=UPI0028AF6DCD|nr:hypothetical protein [Sedimentibacter sp.]
MDFNYFFSQRNNTGISSYLIIADVAGILILMLGLKLSIIYFLDIFRLSKKLKNIICLIGSVMLIFSGINLVLFNRGLQTWFISIVFIMIASLLGRLAHRKF